jgi:hypothetical protein
VAPRIAIHPGDLRGLDRLKIESLVIPMYALRIQPQGVAGFVDWRLSGRLARLIRTGKFRGESGEAVLTTSIGRIGVERVFLLGLGGPESRGIDERKEQMATLIKVLEDAGTKQAAIAPPAAGKEAAPPLDLVLSWITSPAIVDSTLERLVFLDESGQLSHGADRLREANTRLYWS